MAIALTVEDGSNVTGANSYVSLAGANAFFESEIDSADWDAATDPSKERALANAARILNEQYRWLGYPSHPGSQALVWPRSGIRIDYFTVGSDTIPAAIISAQCLIASQLLQSAAFDTAEAEAAGIAKLGLGQGALVVEYAAGAAPGASSLTALSARIAALLRNYGRNRTGSSMVRITRG